MVTILPTDANYSKWFLRKKEKRCYLCYINMELDAIPTVILSPYKYSRGEIVTSYLFAGILK